MAFCPNCGGKIEDGVKFCPNCGTVVEVSKKTENPANEKESSVKKFTEMYQNESDQAKKLELIKAFYVPNTKEELLDFAMYAASQIKSIAKSETSKVNPFAMSFKTSPEDLMKMQKSMMSDMTSNMKSALKGQIPENKIEPEEFLEAWKEKAEQISSKANTLFAGEAAFLSQIQNILAETKEAENKLAEKKTKDSKSMKNNMIIATVASVVIFVAIIIFIVICK